MNLAWVPHLIVLETLLGAGYTSTDTADTWCYEDPKCGPETWAALGHFNGTRQSPINIVTPAAVHNPHLGAVSLAGYGDARKLIYMKNKGTTVEVHLADGLHLSAQGLPAIYTAKSFHLHWGQGAARPGSEHFINHKQFSMELHIVHTKNNLSMADALKDPEGIAVLAFFLQATAHARPSRSWDSFTRHLKNVALKGKKTNLDGSFSLRGLLGSVDLARYYRYHGSLTTPNCDEVVVWTVFPSPILVPPGVVAAFPSILRSTNSDAGPRLQNNYRPLQSLGDRQVQASAALRVTPSSSSSPQPAALIPLLISTAAIAWHL
ncbi:carbonic anhydrase 4-like [Malaclemys terrapin pileata]|uniref:carbonic anhydrase 4-like n=1 Tax=Malaclemys terrapin pileata TaxID=2991368 RepID=UPI0023A7C330|nr:carbonic anhydrase 4-like [Malaclemys terrapin pileata]